LKLKTAAVRNGNHYVVNGQKIWISTAQVASKILLLARTTPIEEVKSRSDGLSLFYTTLDKTKVEVREIEKLGRAAVDSNQLFIDGLCVPVEDRIGAEGKGFQYILHGMNPERILIAAEAVGMGRAALKRAANYANERVVFDRPIGMNQAIQHRWRSAGSNWRPLRSRTRKRPGCTTRISRAARKRHAAKYCCAEGRFQGLRNRGADSRRHGLREGVSRRAACSGKPCCRALRRYHST